VANYPGALRRNRKRIADTAAGDYLAGFFGAEPRQVSIMDPEGLDVGLLKSKEAMDRFNVGTALGIASLLPVGAGGRAATSAASGLIKGATKNAPKQSLSRVTRFGDQPFDRRFDDRVKEADKIANTSINVDERAKLQVPTLSLADYEGHPFITSMSDRSAANGLLTKVNDVELKRPVNLRGGQDFMFENPGMVWSSNQAPVTSIMNAAKTVKEVTGKDPLYLPWRMAPTGGDFASMAGETMLSYAETAMTKTQKKAVDRAIKKINGNWPGLDSPNWQKTFQGFPDAQRKAIKQLMDVSFRDSKGLNYGQARLATTDPRQFQAPDGGLMNVGRIFADKSVIAKSGHPYYTQGVPGEGLGMIDREVSAYELLPQAAQQRGLLDLKAPQQTDLRALQMKPYAGVITPELLKALGY
jgi:hypothetical protein